MKKLIILLFLISSFSFASKVDFEYYIQVASTKDKSELELLKKIAQENSLNFLIRERVVKNILHHRFLIGKFKNRADANKELKKLKKLFKNKTAYISRFRKMTFEIEQIKRDGFESYLNRDFKKMNSSLEKAANLGDKESIYYIGKNYHHGIGIKRDIKKSIFWYKKCLDDIKCLHGLSNIYLSYDFDDIKPNLFLAHKYLIKASILGSKKAKSLLENWDNLEKSHKILQRDKIDIKLVELLFYQNSKNVKIQNLQIINKYIQDGATNINITLLVNKKLKDAFMRIKKNKNGYWEVLEFKVF